MTNQAENNQTKKHQDFSEICKIISKLNTAEDVNDLFKGLLTQSELDDIAQRWNIIKMLDKKESQRSIAKKLSVSLCKITRGAKILKNEKSILRQILFDESWRN